MIFNLSFIGYCYYNPVILFCIVFDFRILFVCVFEFIFINENQNTNECVCMLLLLNISFILSDGFNIDS